jgi:hypothetical protein
VVPGIPVVVALVTALMVLYHAAGRIGNLRRTAYGLETFLSGRPIYFVLADVLVTAVLVARLKGFVLRVAADESEGDAGVCGTILTALSWALIVCTLPFSLCVCFKVW